MCSCIDVSAVRRVLCSRQSLAAVSSISGALLGQQTETGEGAAAYGVLVTRPDGTPCRGPPGPGFPGSGHRTGRRGRRLDRDRRRRRRLRRAGHPARRHPVSRSTWTGISGLDRRAEGVTRPPGRAADFRDGPSPRHPPPIPGIRGCRAQPPPSGGQDRRAEGVTRPPGRAADFRDGPSPRHPPPIPGIRGRVSPRPDQPTTLRRAATRWSPFGGPDFPASARGNRTQCLLAPPGRRAALAHGPTNPLPCAGRPPVGPRSVDPTSRHPLGAQPRCGVTGKWATGSGVPGGRPPGSPTRKVRQGSATLGPCCQVSPRALSRAAA